MNNYCRLCADLKTDDELNIKISDSTLKIHEKLIACCQWNNYQSNASFPSAICYLCYEKLEKSWLFSESIAFAQDKLQEVLREIELAPIKYESDLDNDARFNDDAFNAYDSEPETIFVEPIAPSNKPCRVKKEKKPATKIIAEPFAPSNVAIDEEKPFTVEPSPSFKPLDKTEELEASVLFLRVSLSFYLIEFFLLSDE